jgi:4-amino-4-deoxy-L-arabinose transferase-like glycosyltransferase
MEMNKNRNHQRWILFAILLAILLRVGLLGIAFSHPERTTVTDSGSYILPAQSLLENGYYAYPGGIRMPLYPAFLATFILIFGDNLLPVIVLQVLLGLGTVVLTYRIGLLLGMTQVSSALGAVILSLSLESLVSPFFVLTDTLFTFLLISAAYTLMRFIKNGRLIWLVSTSLLNGFVTLCRPVLALGLVTLMILLVFNNNVHFLKRIGHALIYAVLLVALFIAPWTYRNAQVTGVRTLTTSMDLYWMWGAATVQADLQSITEDQAMVALNDTVDQTLLARGLEATEVNLHNVRGEIGRKIVFDNPGRFILLTLRYDLRSLLPGMGYAVNYLGLSQGNTEGLELMETRGLQGVINNYFSGQALSSLIFLPFVLLLAAAYFGAVIGVVELLKKRDWLALAVLLLPVGYLFLINGYSANSRYRVPFMPFLALLAGIGLPVVWGFLKRKLSKKGVPAK